MSALTHASLRDLIPTGAILESDLKLGGSTITPSVALVEVWIAVKLLASAGHIFHISVALMMF